MACGSKGIYSFTHSSSGCYQYLVGTNDLDEAIEKFIKWQNKERDFHKFPEEMIRDESNWTIDTTIHIIE